jgi:hypothetical protein
MLLHSGSEAGAGEDTAGREQILNNRDYSIRKGLGWSRAAQICSNFPVAAY